MPGWGFRGVNGSQIADPPPPESKTEPGRPIGECRETASSRFAAEGRREPHAADAAPPQGVRVQSQGWPPYHQGHLASTNASSTSAESVGDGRLLSRSSFQRERVRDNCGDAWIYRLKLRKRRFELEVFEEEQFCVMLEDFLVFAVVGDDLTDQFGEARN